MDEVMHVGSVLGIWEIDLYHLYYLPNFGFDLNGDQLLYYFRDINLPMMKSATL